MHMNVITLVLYIVASNLARCFFDSIHGIRFSHVWWQPTTRHEIHCAPPLVLAIRFPANSVVATGVAIPARNYDPIIGIRVVVD